MPKCQSELQQVLDQRFSDAPALSDENGSLQVLKSMVARGSCRAFLETPVPREVVDLLCAAALAAPTKSDLQQCDIIVMQGSEQREKLCALIPDQAWIKDAPLIVVFCGNNRRQRLLHHWHGIAFANDHLDAFFNAAGDAAIALSAFVTASEAMGLGCCPIGAVRTQAEELCNLLNLPQHVFPFAGLALGFPAAAPKIAKRLPMHVTCHVDRYQEDTLQQAVADYDAERAAVQPYASQRFPEIFGTAGSYAWSQDKARQFSQPKFQSFGAFVRARGFNLD